MEQELDDRLQIIEDKLDKLLRLFDKKPTLVTKVTDEQWLNDLCTSPAYEGIDVRREYNRCMEWCRANNVASLSKRRFVNWLNRVEKPIAVKAAPLAAPPVYTKKVESRPLVGEPPPPEVADQLGRLLGRTWNRMPGS